MSYTDLKHAILKAASRRAGPLDEQGLTFFAKALWHYREHLGELSRDPKEAVDHLVTGTHLGSLLVHLGSLIALQEVVMAPAAPDVQGSSLGDILDRLDRLEELVKAVKPKEGRYAVVIAYQVDGHDDTRSITLDVTAKCECAAREVALKRLIRPKGTKPKSVSVVYVTPHGGSNADS